MLKSSTLQKHLGLFCVLFPDYLAQEVYLSNLR
jgi:hypothetical protein